MQAEKKTRGVRVIDSPRILNDFSFSFDRPGYYTTNLVLAELKDLRSKTIAGQGIALGFLAVRDPSSKFLAEVKELAESVGAVLSETDYSVLALALELSREGLDPCIESDDYSLQNLALHFGLCFEPVERKGIGEKRFFRKR